MRDALRRHVTPGQTPQTEQADPRQVRNNAGGYVFTISDRAHLNRFLTLGTEGGTYYVSERRLTRDAAKTVVKMAEASDRTLLEETLAVSEAGRAPRNNAALFALAAAAGLGSTGYRQEALDLLPRVARTGYHLLVWAQYIEMFRGWGPQLTKAVGRWYTAKEPHDLAYQLLKYKQREGWSQRDLMRLSHFGRNRDLTPEHKALFAWAMKGEFDAGLLPPLAGAAQQAHKTGNVRDWVRLIEGNQGLSREMLPSEALSEPAVWRALAESGNLPLGAFLRNLATMTKLGVLRPLDSWTTDQLTRLTSAESVAGARIHPVSVLVALKTYASGHSLRGKATWKPAAQVTDALDEMFYAAFGNVEPAGKRTLIGLDISGSMSTDHAGLGVMSSEITAAMSMITARTEPQYAVMGFDHNFRDLGISPHQRLDDVTQRVASMTFGATDCSLPMRWALQNSLGVDTFQVWTDGETWAGPVHAREALKQYRKRTGIDARLQVIATAATNFSIADPADPGMIDVSGFDSAVPAMLASHARSEI